MAGSHRLREEDAVDPAAVGQLDRPLVEAWRLARLDPGPDLIGQPGDLTGDRDATPLDAVHPRVHAPDREDPIVRRGPELPQELSSLQVGVQLQPSHQGPVHEQLDRHGPSLGYGCDRALRRTRPPPPPPRAPTIQITTAAST